MEENEAPNPINSDKSLSLKTKNCEESKMKSLFPLKIDIPDFKSNLDYFSRMMLRQNIAVCFLFSSEVKLKDIKIENRNKIYPLREIIENGKTLSVFYIEVYDIQNLTFKIEIPTFTNPVFVKIDKDKLRDGENKLFFLYNESLYDKENKVIKRLNCFDILDKSPIFFIFFKIVKISSLNGKYSFINIFNKKEKFDSSLLLSLIRFSIEEYRDFNELAFFFSL